MNSIINDLENAQSGYISYKEQEDDVSCFSLTEYSTSVYHVLDLPRTQGRLRWTHL